MSTAARKTPRHPRRPCPVSPSDILRRRPSAVHRLSLCRASDASLGDGIIIPRPAEKRISPFSHVCRTKIARKLQMRGDRQPKSRLPPPWGDCKVGTLQRQSLHRKRSPVAGSSKRAKRALGFTPAFTQGRLGLGERHRLASPRGEAVPQGLMRWKEVP